MSSRNAALRDDTKNGCVVRTGEPPLLSGHPRDTSKWPLNARVNGG